MILKQTLSRLRRASHLRLLVAGLCAAVALTACDSRSGIQITQEISEPHFVRGQRLERSGRYPEALEAFIKVIDKRGSDPGAPESHLEVGLLYAQHINDPLSAIYHFRKYLALRPNSPQAPLVRQRIDAAIRDFARTLPAQPLDGSQLQRVDLVAAGALDRIELFGGGEQSGHGGLGVWFEKGWEARRSAEQRTSGGHAPAQQRGGAVAVLAVGRGEVIEHGEHVARADCVGPFQRAARVVHALAHRQVGGGGGAHPLEHGVGRLVGEHRDGAHHRQAGCVVQPRDGARTVAPGGGDAALRKNLHRLRPPRFDPGPVGCYSPGSIESVVG